MRVFLTGGGTAGSVTPLLAIAEELPNDEVWFIGTKYGVERELVGEKLKYKSVPAGKLRRYFDARNFIDPFIIMWAFLVAVVFLLFKRPAVVVSAGSFVSVPVVWAAWLLGIKNVVHQQDLQVGLSTKLMKPFASDLTKAFNDIPLQGAVWTGNPVRDLTTTTDNINIDSEFPTVLVFGGGTGAIAINELVIEQLCDEANVIHITGEGKSGPSINHVRYHQYDLLKEEMKEALYKADVVVSRAGLATISELAVLGKPAIIIPIPNSHQEINAEFLKKNNAAKIINQNELTAKIFTKEVMDLLRNETELNKLQTNIQELAKSDATQQLVKIIKQAGNNK
ncbi:MAG: UDP-N-acetylglucosamine--N-acetylmuramyl-(pentapeptide) pyrophosphoryl-undecaprenol N-acetylglucosamine transferase [bacterium]|nr:UDP-N-acetylglucosamine--N-acetylmuramyl-(pentapeptide) pyrophosphoryl-undecaprenol N-acetylglucosamine transferase [bacterium]